MKKSFILFSLLICIVLNSHSQTKRVLFLGNSYTAVNNLPQTFASVASSMGDNVYFDSNTPGGCTFQMHSADPASVGKINMGNWDYVVLQEQSQLPSFPDNQVVSEVFPYARALDSLIVLYNPCAETVFYMTWGRKNGDASNCASWPPVCTYNGMDSLLNLRYRMMADSNKAIVSPVGAVWRYIRQNYPLLELYQTDESHPSEAGTYLAAVCFYTTIYRKDPTLVTYNSTLSLSDANIIRNAVKLIVYNNLINWHIGEYDPQSNFTFLALGNQVSFTNTSLNAVSYSWNFGDGNASGLANPSHTYNNNGIFNVQLIAGNCGMQDTVIKVVNVISTGLENENTIDFISNLYPNPVESKLNINLNTDLPDNLRFKILNFTGKVILCGNISKSNFSVDVSELSDGIYFLQLFNNNRTLGHQKFIKSVNLK